MGKIQVLGRLLTHVETNVQDLPDFGASRDSKITRRLAHKVDDIVVSDIDTFWRARSSYKNLL